MPPDPGGTVAEEHDEMITHEGEAVAAAALRHIARDEQIKAYMLRHPPRYDALLRAARRFIGGETLPQCLAGAATLEGRGFATTIDHLGESTRDALMARQPTDEFRHVSGPSRSRSSTPRCRWTCHTSGWHERS